MLVVGLRWESLRITKPDLPKTVTGEKKERIFFFFFFLLPGHGKIIEIKGAKKAECLAYSKLVGSPPDMGMF